MPGAARRAPVVILVVLGLALLLGVGAGLAVVRTGLLGQPGARTSASASTPAKGSSVPGITLPPPTTPGATPSASPTDSTPPDLPAAYAKVKSGLVRVLASTCSGTGIGTGFLIGPTTVVTASSTVEKAVSVAVESGSTPVVATVVGRNSKAGLAVLRLAKGLDGARLGLVSNLPGVGAAVGVAGWPAGDGKPGLTVTQVTGTHGTTSGNGLQLDGLVQLDGPTDLGLSGAPLIDGQGRALGMVVAPQSQAALLAVPGADLVAAAGQLSRPAAATCGSPRGPRVDTQLRGDAPGAVRNTLHGYFHGINSRDYRTALDQFPRGYFASESNTKRGWTSSYDFNVRIRAAANSQAWVTFDSIFAAGRGPIAAATCAHWSLVYLFDDSSGRTLITRVEAKGTMVKAC